jgi:hypothetical protein
LGDENPIPNWPPPVEERPNAPAVSVGTLKRFLLTPVLVEVVVVVAVMVVGAGACRLDRGVAPGRFGVKQKKNRYSQICLHWSPWGPKMSGL